MFSLDGLPKKIRFDKIHFPGALDLDTEEVKEMEMSFVDTNGAPIHYPLVTRVDGKIEVVTGRTRLRALKRAGKKEVMVQFVTGDPVELMRVQILENLQRRNDDKSKLLEMFALTRQVIVGTGCPVIAHGANGKTRVGRPPSEKTSAIREIAGTLDKTPDAIKKAIQRATVTAGPLYDKKKTAPPPADDGVPIPTLGRPVPTLVRARILRDIARIEKMSTALTQLRKDINQYRIDTPELGGRPRWDTHYGALQEAIRDSMPTMICPHCKLLDEARPCTACADMGYIGVSASKRAEAALLLEGDAAGVFIGGKWRTVYSITGEDF